MPRVQREKHEGLQTLQALTWSGAVSRVTFERVRAQVTSIRMAGLSVAGTGLLASALSGFLLPPDFGVPLCVMGSLLFVFVPFNIARVCVDRVVDPEVKKAMRGSVGFEKPFAIPSFQSAVQDSS